MLIYIWIRFEWQFSLGAILALFHDVIVTLGVFIKIFFYQIQDLSKKIQMRKQITLLVKMVIEKFEIGVN